MNSSFAHRAPSDQPYTHLKGLACVTALIALIEYASYAIGASDFANRVGPIMLALVSLWAAARIIWVSPPLFLSCLPWALAATGAYSGIGPLILVFGAKKTIYAIPPVLRMTSDELLRTNILNAAFITLVLVAYVLFPKKADLKLAIKTFVKNIHDASAAKQLIVICLGIGLPLRLFITIPYELGVFRFHLPGMIYSLGNLTTVALIPLWYLLAAKQRPIGWVAIPLLSAEIAYATILFSKTNVLASFIFAGLGYYLAKPSRTVLITLVFCVFLTMKFGSPVFALAREQGRLRPGFSGLQTRIERLSRIVQDKSGILTRREKNDPEGGWSRLNYANVQGFVMRKHDAGMIFDSYKNSLWVFVPRVLYPKKPNMTGIGVELNYMIHKHRGSSMAVGVAAEAYGVGGYVYVVAVGLLIGSIFAFLDSRFVFSLEHGWLYLPVQMLSMRMAYRLDGILVADYLGTLVILICYTQIVKFLVPLWFGKRENPSS